MFHNCVCVWPIQISDISFPRNRKGSLKPLKTLWRSTMGVQSPSTEATEATYTSRVGVQREKPIELIAVELLCPMTYSMY